MITRFAVLAVVLSGLLGYALLWTTPSPGEPIASMHADAPVPIALGECDPSQYLNMIEVMKADGDILELPLNCWGGHRKMALRSGDDARPFAIVVVMLCKQPVRLVGVANDGNVYSEPAKGIPAHTLSERLATVSADHVGYIQIPGPACKAAGRHTAPPPRGGANL
jgi:hypothetical protein